MVDFNGESITSDAGLPLVRQADQSMGLWEELSSRIVERPDTRYTEHDLLPLLLQRIYQIVAGYEECDDANFLRTDPALKTTCGKMPSATELGSQPALSWLEINVTQEDLSDMAVVCRSGYPPQSKELAEENHH